MSIPITTMGLQTDQAPLAEVPQAHFAPAVIVGVADDKAGKHEEEVHAKIAVVDDLVGRNSRVAQASFKKVEQHDHDGRHSPEAVKNGVMGLGRQQGGTIGERGAHGRNVREQGLFSYREKACRRRERVGGGNVRRHNHIF